MRKSKLLSLILVAAFVWLTQTAVKADEAFRNHRYSSFKALPPCKTGDIVFIGNSITNMMDWYEAFGSQQNIHGRGNSGGYSQEVLDNLESMIAGDPSKVFLMIGTNDLGTLGDFYTPELTAERIEKILQRIRKEAPNATVYYQSILPSTSGNRTQAKTEQTNGLVKEWIDEQEDKKLVYIDLYTSLKADNGAMKNSSASQSETSYSYDNLHLTQKGYKVWMDLLKPHIGYDCVFPSTAKNIWGGQTGSNGMRVTHFGAFPVSETDILLIGDEMIHNGEWHELLGSPHFKDRGIGWGYPSMNIASMANTFDAILTGNSGNGVQKDTPRAVCFYAGLTDVQAGTNAQTIITNYTNAIKSLRTKLPEKTPIFAMTILPFPANDNARKQSIETVNQEIKKLENASDSIFVIDVYSATYNGNARVEDCFMGTSNVYLSGYGYACVAKKIGETINEKLKTAYTALEPDVAKKNETRYNLRTAIYSNTFEVGTGLGQYNEEKVDEYYNKAKQLLDEFEAGTTKDYTSEINAAVAAAKQALNTPSDDNATDREFLLYTPNRGSMYMTSTGNGKGVIGKAQNNYKESRWKFVKRNDNTWDIQNVSDHSYLSPTAAHNTQISTSNTSPSRGWSFSYCNNNGLYIINSDNVQLNQTTTGELYNWSGDQSGTNRSDLGCQFQIVDVTDIPADIHEPLYTAAGTLEIGVNKANGGLYRGGAFIDSGWGSLWLSNDETLTFTAGANNMQWVGNNIDARSGTAQSSSYNISCSEEYEITGFRMKLTAISNSVQNWNINGQSYTTSTTSDTKEVNITGLHTQNVSMSLTGANTGTLITDFVVMLQSNKSTVIVDMEHGKIADNQWRSNDADSLLTLKIANGTGSVAATDNLVKLSYTGDNATFTMAVPYGYAIVGYEYSFSTSSGDITITPKGQEAITGECGYVNIANCNDSIVSFTLSGTAKDITTSYFYVYIEKIDVEELTHERFVVFETPTTGTPYRIPAIAKTQNGDLVAVADYRYSKADIGMATNGKLDLRFRIKDHATGEWGDVQTLIAAKGSGNTNVAFGDPCIVADRESDRVLVTSCCGNVSFPNGTHDNHQGWARIYSEDGGKHWGDYTDISDQVFKQLDLRSDGQIRCFFIGSGKIVQSTTVKVDKYYRLYCAALVKVNDGTNTNYVFYSDDFGENWTLLGDPDDCPIPSGADEPKAEELPDGSVLVSSRISGGRYYNVYHFTDTKTGAGSWGTMAASNSSVNGLTASSNACNGETLCLPVVRNSDQKKMYLLLQSVPFGPSDRSHVGINYKELADLSDFRTGSDVAKNWDGAKQVTALTSAYSTMTLDANNNIAFFFEENSKNSGYDIVYKKYTIEEITDNAYSYAPMAASDSTSYLKEAVSNYMESIDNQFGNIVGMYSEEARATIEDAQAAYDVAPSYKAYNVFNKALSTAKRVEIETGQYYYLKNYGRSTSSASYLMALNNDKSYFVGANINPANITANNFFTFYSAPNEGEYYLVHPDSHLYFGTLGATETQSPTVSTPTSAGIFRIESSTLGLSALRNLNHTGNNWYIHLAGDLTRLVPWSATDPSLWYIVPVPDDISGLGSMKSEMSVADSIIYDLTGRKVNSAAKGGIYIINGEKVMVK